MSKNALLFLFVAMLTTRAVAFSQNNVSLPDTTKNNVARVGPAPAVRPEIVGVKVRDEDEKKKTKKDAKNTFHLGDKVVVKLSNAEAFRKTVPDDSIAYLYINSVALRGIEPMKDFYYEDKAGTSKEYVELTYKIDRSNDLSAAALNEVYHSVKKSSKVLCDFAVGVPGKWRTPTYEGSPRLWYSVIWNDKVAIFVAVFIALMLGSAVLLAMRSNLLRDKTKLKEKNGEKMRIFSLAKSQLFFWSVIIISCYFAVWGLTGTLPALNSSTLVLLCISMVTTGGAKLIEVSQLGTGRNNDFEPRNFFYDILSDSKGINIHRFQMVLWTIGLGSYFVVEVIQNLAFPVFDDTLLALMGISNGTYLGLKIPEFQDDNKTNPQEQNNQNQGAPQPADSETHFTELKKGMNEIKEILKARKNSGGAGSTTELPGGDSAQQGEG